MDQLRNLRGRFDDGRAVDLVAFPTSEADVAALLAACTELEVARPEMRLCLAGEAPAERTSVADATNGIWSTVRTQFVQ